MQHKQNLSFFTSVIKAGKYVHELIATRINTARRIVYMAMNKGNRDIVLSDSIVVETHNSGHNLQRFHAMLEILRRQRCLMRTTDSTIAQINTILAWADENALRLEIGNNAYATFFAENLLSVTYVIDSKRRMRVWFAVISKSGYETKRAFFVQGLEDPNLAETISIAF